MHDRELICEDNIGRITYRDFVGGQHHAPCDQANHGTHTAAIILGTARNAQLLVGRIVEGRHFQDPKSIAEVRVETEEGETVLKSHPQGIKYATNDWYADIICMSFGYDRYSPELSEIQSAILQAYSKNVILIAAAANHGGLENVSYPANQEQVICISSTDGHGNASRFNPSPQQCNIFSVLGEAVPSNGAERKSGTSFAAPIAAGIAAVTIEYLNKRKVSWLDERRDVASRIKSRKGILAVMKNNLSSGERDGFRFLRPWKLFQKDFDRIDALLLDSLEDV
jgi:hypothetical protein